MQTFLPYDSFFESALVLDRQRLGKQRVETFQILKALAGESSGWVNHPCTRMWRGHGLALVRYGLAVCDEWVRRGYKDTCAGKISDVGRFCATRLGSAEMPPWMGDESFHLSHRSNLLRKDPDWYGDVFDLGTPTDLPYVWPVP